jgi:hypothetical protein
MTQIYRGTTPSITLQVTGVDLSFQDTWPVVAVTLKNGDKEIDVQRDFLDIKHTDTGCSVAFALTQVQTLAFDYTKKVSVQLRAKDAAGRAIATDIAYVTVDDVIKDGEI